MAERFDPSEWGGLHMTPNPGGAFVRYDDYETLRAQLAEREREVAALREWRPIETAPRDGQTIILFRRMEPWNVIGYGYWADVDSPYGLIDGWLAYGFSDPPGNLGLGAPTHWMPLPEPPTTEDDK